MRQSKIIVYICSFFVLLTWISVIYNYNFGERKVKSLIIAAEEASAKKIYVDSVNYYRQAFEINPNDNNVANKYCQELYFLGNVNEFIVVCKKVIATNSKNAFPYIMLATFYEERNDIKKAQSILQQGKIATGNKEISRKLSNLRGRYSKLYKSYGEISNWYEGFALGETSRGWEIIEEDGGEFLSGPFDEIGNYDDGTGVIPVQLNNERYYVDKMGNRKLVGDYNYTKLGTFSEGVAAAQLEGKMGFINKEFKHFSFKYKYVSGMKNKVAAVQNRDLKWAIIDNTFKLVTNFIYDEIIIDENGFCSTAGVIFVKQNGKYFLIDVKGNKVGKEEFTTVSPFISNEPAAVEENGKWGFINVKGEYVIKPIYDNAESYLNGKGIVFQDELWGYIDTNNRWIIKPEFFSAKNFSKKGIAAVQIQNGKWELIQLYNINDNT